MGNKYLDCINNVCHGKSEATDLAIRLAQHHTRNTEMITLDHAYHGHIISALNISPYKLYQQVDNSHLMPEHVYVVPCPDTYRGKYTDISHPEQDLGQLYADEVKNAINKMKSQHKSPSFFIAESMQSCGGQIIYPPGYLQKVYKYVHDAGGICIADEVQVGFGRVGSDYWAFQPQGVVPDIVTIGKPMGNGHPVAAVVTTKDISDSFKASGMSYFNTYGGNPVSCAIASAVLDVIEKEKLITHAKDVGQYWTDKLKSMMSEFSIIGDVRGLGLFLGIDLVKDRNSRAPATEEADYVIERMKKEFIILSTDGPHSNVLKMKPPMTLNRDDVDFFCSKLAIVFKELENKNNNAMLDTNVTTEVSNTTSCHNDNKVTDFLSEVQFNGSFPLTETSGNTKSLKVY
ncbi:hypothetical protein KUTeg_003851 [Tegillarca granosa]|uniref:Uncharacterized protein n=1 Tax=Tegillarca granosa TaxID=220873 RepID=A0ABQ9FR55_TEGGR|nr:hypothetical protein KUTeg_003851 [Tegillarca granosa]